VSDIVLLVFGTFACNGNGGRAMFGMSVNEYTMGVKDISPRSGCLCDTCDGAERFSFSWRNGAPTYKYGITNFFKFEVYTDSICINRIEATLTYQPRTSSLLPEFYLPFTIPPDLDLVGCPVCNGVEQNQWCSAALNNTLALGFKDPLPVGAQLVAMDVYLSLNLVEKSRLSPSNITVSVQGVPLGVTEIRDTNWRDKCGCLGDFTLQSEVHQDGWPGYVPQGLNYLEVTVQKHEVNFGNVCVGRVHLKIIYSDPEEPGALKSFLATI